MAERLGGAREVLESRGGTMNNPGAVATGVQFQMNHTTNSQKGAYV
jgi:hypothetical protein